MNSLNLIIAKAQATNVPVGLCPDGSANCGVGYDIDTYVRAILEFSQKVGGAVVVLMVVYAGLIYVTSRGDSAKLTAAKDRVIGAVLGYLILILTITIFNYISLKQP